MTKKFTIASIMTALALVCLFGSAYLPTGRIALLAITSMCILVTVSQCGARYGWLQYTATSILAILLIPFKFQVLLFIALLGYYPMVKLYIEKIDKLWLEWIVKILFFSALLIITYFVVTYILAQRISFGAIFDVIMTHLLLVVVISEVVFIIYDYLLSFFAKFYNENIKDRIR